MQLCLARLTWPADKTFVGQDLRFLGSDLSKCGWTKNQSQTARADGPGSLGPEFGPSALALRPNSAQTRAPKSQVLVPRPSFRQANLLREERCFASQGSSNRQAWTWDCVVLTSGRVFGSQAVALGGLNVPQTHSKQRWALRPPFWMVFEAVGGRLYLPNEQLSVQKSAGFQSQAIQFPDLSNWVTLRARF